MANNTGPRLSTPFQNNVNERPLSRYTQGGIADRYARKTGWWERREFNHRYDDVIITVSPKYVGRPDLIAHAVLGDAKLAWVILQYNNIVDINTELVIGKEIRIPSQHQLYQNMLGRKTGGNKV